MCDRINEASQERNEDNASRNSRQPAKKPQNNLPAKTRIQRSIQQTEERQEEQRHRFKAAVQVEEEMNAHAKKDKKSNSSGAPAERRP